MTGVFSQLAREATDMSQGFSRAAHQVTQNILDFVEDEILELQKEKKEYSRTLAELEKLEAEQEAIYEKAEKELLSKKERLEAELSEVKHQQPSVAF